MQKPLSEIRNDKDLPQAWTESDAAYVRVVEDLIQVQIDKRIIECTDLPPMVQEKTRERQKARRMMAKMLAEDDSSLILLATGVRAQIVRISGLSTNFFHTSSRLVAHSLPILSNMDRRACRSMASFSSILQEVWSATDGFGADHFFGES